MEKERGRGKRTTSSSIASCSSRMVTPRRLAVAIVNMYKECRPCYWPEGEHCVEAACPSKSMPLTISSITLKLRSFRANFEAPAASVIIMRSVARVAAASSVRVHNALCKRERELSLIHI